MLDVGGLLPGLDVGLQPLQVTIELVLRVGPEQLRDGVPDRAGDRVVAQLDLDPAAESRSGSTRILPVWAMS